MYLGSRNSWLQNKCMNRTAPILHHHMCKGCMKSGGCVWLENGLQRCRIQPFLNPFESCMEAPVLVGIWFLTSILTCEYQTTRKVSIQSYGEKKYYPGTRRGTPTRFGSCCLLQGAFHVVVLLLRYFHLRPQYLANIVPCTDFFFVFQHLPRNCALE